MFTIIVSAILVNTGVVKNMEQGWEYVAILALLELCVEVGLVAPPLPALINALR